MIYFSTANEENTAFYVFAKRGKIWIISFYNENGNFRHSKRWKFLIALSFICYCVAQKGIQLVVY